MTTAPTKARGDLKAEAEAFAAAVTSAGIGSVRMDANPSMLAMIGKALGAGTYRSFVVGHDRVFITEDRVRSLLAEATS